MAGSMVVKSLSTRLAVASGGPNPSKYDVGIVRILMWCCHKLAFVVCHLLSVVFTTLAGLVGNHTHISMLPPSVFDGSAATLSSQAPRGSSYSLAGQSASDVLQGELSITWDVNLRFLELSPKSGSNANALTMQVSPSAMITSWELELKAEEPSSNVEGTPLSDITSASGIGSSQLDSVS